MAWTYDGIAATGKNVPDRNIIGFVITFETASPVSGFETTEPIAKPIARKHRQPASATGIAAQAVDEMWMPNTIRPKASSTTTCMMATTSDAVIRAAKNSASGIGVSLMRRRMPRWRQSTRTVESPITAEIMIERARMPGSRKSMYVSDEESTDWGRKCSAGALPVAATVTPSAAPETMPRMIPAWSADVFEVYSLTV